MFKWVCNLTLDNSIEIKHRELGPYVTIEYVDLYRDFSHRRLQEVFSTLHSLLTTNYNAMNSRLPTGDTTKHFWADNSRELILAIDMIESLQRILKSTVYSFDVDDYYQKVIEESKNFLEKSCGSEIPKHMEKIELYYTIPIFTKSDKKKIVVNVPQIKTIDHAYIKDISFRALDDVQQGHFDSAITKSRTLLEEVFCHAIERKSQKPETSGDIMKLYKQVRGLYNMHTDKGVDKRINKLLSGLSSIVDAISEMRNKDSDAHGVGSNRINIYEYHARLFVNSAMAVADFILSVEKRANSTA